MDFLEVIPGRNIGKLHVLKKVGNLNGEECFLCRDERGRNIQFVESDIIGQAGEVVPGEAPEVIEEEVVEDTPSVDETQLQAIQELPQEPEGEVLGEGVPGKTEEVSEPSEDKAPEVSPEPKVKAKRKPTAKPKKRVKKKTPKNKGGK